MDKKVFVAITIVVIVIVASMALTLQTLDDAFNATMLLTNQKIGLVINTPDASTSLKQVQDIYLQAATTGIGRSNVYIFWDMIEPEKGEFDWRQSDILMRLNKDNNLKVTLYFSLINGKALGPFPDWIGNPSLRSVNDDQVVEALDAILTRYNIVDTVIIAGETDAHFRHNEQNIPVYKELFGNIYTKLKQKHPDIQIGNAYSLNGIINKNLGHIVSDLDIGDFVGFTYFPVDTLNDITKTPYDAKQDLEHALQIANGTRAAFFEISWSTSDLVNGSEADQRRFVEKAFEFYNENESEIEFLTWYRQYDKSADSCAYNTEFEEKNGDDDVAIGGSSGLGSSEHVIQRLGSYICSAGLINEDGTPKPSWGEFKHQIINLDS